MSHWRSIKKGWPKEYGIYAVAKFVDGQMVEFCPDWARIENYFGPNNAAYWGALDITHWMPQKEYLAALAALPLDD